MSFKFKKEIINLPTKLVSIAIIGFFLISSCSSSTIISSGPDNAELYVNGKFVGETPYELSNSSLSGTCLSLKLKSKGYINRHAKVCKNEEVNIGALIGGLLFLLPFVWIGGYQDYHHYEMKKEKSDYDKYEKNFKYKVQTEKKSFPVQKEKNSFPHHIESNL